MNENIEDDIITQIYYNELNGIQDLPKRKEYTDIITKIRIMEKRYYKIIKVKR